MGSFDYGAKGYVINLKRNKTTGIYTLSYSLLADYNWFFNDTITLDLISNFSFRTTRNYGRDTVGIRIELKEKKVYAYGDVGGWRLIGNL